MSEPTFSGPESAGCIEPCAGCPFGTAMGRAASQVALKQGLLEKAIITDHELTLDRQVNQTRLNDALAITEATAAMGDEVSAHQMDFLRRRGLLDSEDSKVREQSAQYYAKRRSARIDKLQNEEGEAAAKLARAQQIGAQAAEQCSREAPITLKVPGVDKWLRVCGTRAPLVRGRMKPL